MSSEEPREDVQAAQAAQAQRVRNAWLLRVGSLVVAATFVFFLRDDLRYAAAPAQPTELGGPLEYNLDREHTQTFAHVAGVPGPQAANVTRMGKRLRVFGLLGSNILVVQELAGATPESTPSRGEPFAVSGRLVRDDDAAELRSIFTLMEGAGTISEQDGHAYALWAGEAPRSGYTLWAELVGIVLFVLANFWAAGRTLRPVAGLDDEPLSDG